MRIYFENLYMNDIENLNLILNLALKNKEKKFIITANPETFMNACHDKEMSELVLNPDVLMLPESVGIVTAANMLGYSIKKRIPGIEVAEKLLEFANNQGDKTIYLFGSHKEVIEKMKIILSTRYSNLRLIDAKDGYNHDYDEVFEDIIVKQPDIVLVALGIPIQEKLIYKYLYKFHKGIFIGVGGAMDVISGYKKRAPKIFIKLNLEWLYRIIKEPRRIKRFYQNNIKFFLEVRKLKKNK